jgi:hypothetical protein
MPLNVAYVILQITNILKGVKIIPKTIQWDSLTRLNQTVVHCGVGLGLVCRVEYILKLRLFSIFPIAWCKSRGLEPPDLPWALFIFIFFYLSFLQPNLTYLIVLRTSQ